MRVASKILYTTVSGFGRILLSILTVFLTLAAFTGGALAQEATQTSITLTWTAPGDDGDIGTAASYDIRYSLSSINASNWNDATQVTGEPSPQTAGSPLAVFASWRSPAPPRRQRFCCPSQKISSMRSVAPR